MKVSEIILLITVFLGLAGAFQNFFSVDFFAKLVALAVSEIIVLWMTAQRLSDWVKKEQPRSWLKLATGILALGLICTAVSLAALFVLWFYAINIEVTDRGDRVDFWIRGSRQAATKLYVGYPIESKCIPMSDPNKGSKADTAMEDSDRVNPRLAIRNFFYPQSQGVSCQLGTTVSQLRFEVEPHTVEILKPEHRSEYSTLIFSVGGFLWIASIFYVGLRSR